MSSMGVRRANGLLQEVGAQSAIEGRLALLDQACARQPEVGEAKLTG